MDQGKYSRPSPTILLGRADRDLFFAAALPLQQSWTHAVQYVQSRTHTALLSAERLQEAMGEEATLSRVFVGKLAQRTTAEDIETAFGDYGTVVKVEKKENLTGSFAFVFYNESSHAQAAIAAMNGKELHGNEIVVEAARGRVPQSGSGSGVVSSTKGIKELRISCTGLDDRTSWQDLKDWARAAGNVTFANTFNKDGQLIGVIEYEVRRVYCVRGSHLIVESLVSIYLTCNCVAPFFQSVNDVTNALDTLETVPCRGANLKLFKVRRKGAVFWQPCGRRRVWWRMPVPWVWMRRRNDEAPHAPPSPSCLPLSPCPACGRTTYLGG